VQFETLIDLLIYISLALGVIAVLYWLLRQSKMESNRTGNGGVSPGRMFTARGFDGKTGRTFSDTDRRNKLIESTEAKRREVKKRMMARFATDDPEKAAKLLRSLILKNEDEKK